MNQIFAFTKRNIKIFFRDKGLFFVSLITPMVLLVLFVTFLGSVYKDSFSQIFSSVPNPPDERVINGLAAGQLVSSLLSVVPVTVAFCANMVSPQDKTLGITDDFFIAPVNRVALGFSYFVATFICDFIISAVALVGGLSYIAAVGWYLSFGDVVVAIANTLLLCLFGSALSSLVNSMIKSKGAMSAVGSLVSSVYGFLCGAYMPLSQFPAGLRNVLMFLPGTYGTGILRNTFMSGAVSELSATGMPAEALTGLRNLTDCNLYIFGAAIPQFAYYIILGAATLLCCAAMCLMVIATGREGKRLKR